MRFIWIWGLVLLLTGCMPSHHLPDRESLSTSRVASAPHLPSPLPTDGLIIDRSITHEEVELLGSYQGSFGSSQGTGSLLMSGYFGMVDEPVDLTWSGSWQLSGMTMLVDSVSGSLLFGPRNQHSMTLSGQSTHPLPRLGSQLELLDVLVPETLEGIYHTGLSGDVYRVGLSGTLPRTGRGDESQLVLTGIYDDMLYTGTLINAEREIQYGEYTSTVNDSTLSIRHRYDARDVLDCDFEDDLSEGTCLLPGVVGDAFSHHTPLALKWETHLASH